MKSIMDKVYPKDILGIKKIGVERWLNDYYIPVTGEDFNMICKNAYNSYFQTLENYNDEVVRWIAVANMNINNSIAWYILEVIRLAKLKEGGYGYLASNEVEKIPDDILDYKFPSVINNLNVIDRAMSNLSFKERIKNVFSTIKHNIYPAFIGQNFITNISKPSFQIGYRHQKEMTAFCENNNISPIHLAPLLFANKGFQNYENDDLFYKIVGFVDRFLTSLKGEYLTIDNKAFEILRSKLEECFTYSLMFFQQNINCLRRLKPKQLLVSGLGYPVHRLFCASWRYLGGEVIGFVHGNNYCYGYVPGIVKYLLLVSQYVTISSGHSKLLKKASEDFSHGLKMGDVTYTNQGYYYQMFEKMQKSNSTVQRIKKIMIVGFPMTNFYYYNLPGNFAFAQLDYELRIMNILKSNGYYIIYKPHPRTSNEVEGVFNGYVDEVIEERFEEAYDTADCIVFGSFATSTFGYTLLTNKPIVLFNVAGNYWYPKAFELIKRRCTVVEAKTVDGRVVFDEKDVLHAVQESINNINYDILYEFAF